MESLFATWRLSRAAEGTLLTHINMRSGRQNVASLSRKRESKRGDGLKISLEIRVVRMVRHNGILQNSGEINIKKSLGYFI